MFTRWFGLNRKNKSSQRRQGPPSPVPKPRRFLPLLEELESRYAPSVTVSIIGGVLTAQCDGGANTLTVDHSGSFAVINGTSWSDGAYSSIRINGGDGGTTSNIHANVRPVTINGNGADTVNVGAGHRLDGVAGDLILTNTRLTTLNVDDSGDDAFNSVTMDTVSIGGYDYGRIQGLGALPGTTITYKYFDTRSVTVQTGTDPGPGLNAAVVDVQATGTDTHLIGHGHTVVNIGDAGRLNGIHGDLTITNPPSFTTLNVDESAETAATTVNLNSVFFGTSEYGRIEVFPSGQPTTALIYYKYADTTRVTFKTGIGTATTNVFGTGANVPLTLINQASSYVHIGEAQKLQNIKGELTIRNQPGSGVIELDDSGDPFAHDGMVHGGILYPQINFDTYTPAGETVHGRITGLAPAAINYRASGVVGVIARGGIGDGVNYNVFNVNSTPAGVQSDLYGNGHANQFTVAADGSAGGVLAGPVALHGNSTPATVSFAVYYDYFSPGGQTYTLTANSISRTGVATVTYDNLGEMILATSSSGGNTINVQSNADGGYANIQAADGDHVNIGSTAPAVGGALDTIHGAVAVGCYDFSNVVTVTVDDSGNTSTAARNVTFEQPYILPPTNDPSIVIRGLTTNPAEYIHYLLGATSSVTVLGGAGNTTYHMQDFLANVPLTLNAGSGTNTLDYSAATGNVYVNLQTGVATDLAGLSNIKNVIGASGGAAGSYNILVGNGGNVLTGGNGRRNLLIAGATASTLNGGDGEDILIAGTTSYDTDDAALQAIMTEWARTDEDFATRVQRLTNGVDGLPILDATTVTGNGGSNSMYGNGGLAWIFSDGLDTIIGFDPSSPIVTIVP